MHLFNQEILGAAILVLLGALVIVKQVATGSVLDRPKGSFLLQFVNVFNLFFLLVVNPLAAILLISHQIESVDPTHAIIGEGWVLTALEIVGLALYLIGFLLMTLALIRLGRNYQLGGSTPRANDAMITDGPYRLMRHPMYTAALSIALGLACLIQSWACVVIFCLYLGLIVMLIPVEEAALEKVYGSQYDTYQHKTRRLIPLVY